MNDQQPAAPDDLRRDVRRALESGRIESLTKACQFLAGLAAICGVVGGGVAVLNKFSALWLFGLGTTTVGGGVLAYAINELSRLPGVGNNHPDQLRHLNLVGLAPAATLHISSAGP